VQARHPLSGCLGLRHAFDNMISMCSQSKRFSSRLSNGVDASFHGAVDSEALDAVD